MVLYIISCLLFCIDKCIGLIINIFFFINFVKVKFFLIIRMFRFIFFFLIEDIVILFGLFSLIKR
ncbi:hypothetical protein GCM10010095_85270 [Streptomyces anthocyanicus]|nr:hypothetical protein GCM10010095_85270 [Streptomyces anthocyanicus]